MEVTDDVFAAATRFDTDVLVIGAGAAGLRAAAAAAPAGDVLVAAKTEPMLAHSSVANGMNAMLASAGRWEDHAFDTVKGSDFLADQDAVEALCRDAADVVAELRSAGVPFAAELVGRFGSRPYHLPSITGRAILSHTLAELGTRPGVRIVDGVHVVALLRHRSEDRCVGALGYRPADGSYVHLRAAATVLATGGGGQLYSPTSTDDACTGDGMSLALRLGAELMDLEMVQYHPTTLPGTGRLISESARNAGAHLVNAAGERFMTRYAPTELERAPRDVVTRAIRSELAAGRGFGEGTVALDFTVIDDLDEVFRRQSTSLDLIETRAWEEAGTDIRRTPLRVRPGAHYFMGGVRIDVHGRTSVPGLFACGEVACASVHGANRLGGNSLLDTVVFGRRAGRAAAGHAARRVDLEPCRDLSGALPDAAAASERHHGVAALRRKLGVVMDTLVGPVRSAHGLRAALADVAVLRRELDRVVILGGSSLSTVELGGMLELAEAVCLAALGREESRGAHQRSDHPARDDSAPPRHTIIRRGADRLELSHREAVVTRWNVAPRTY